MGLGGDYEFGRNCVEFSKWDDAKEKPEMIDRIIELSYNVNFLVI